jgi:branched-chain amino acid transport system substrate-binding protein
MAHATRSALLASAALVVAIAAGCASPAQTTSQSSASSDEVIKIGVDLPLSGADASDGIPIRNGIVLAVEQANRRGVAGGFRFAVDDLDDAEQGKHDPALGAQNTKSFVSDDSVLAMLGPFNSNVAQAEIPITNDAGLAQISPATTNTGLTKGDAAAKLRSSHPGVNAFFRVCATDDRQGLALAVAARKTGVKRAFVIDDDETYGKGLADVFAAQFVRLGGTVLGREHLTAGQTDFKALLTKARALGPDVLFFGGTTSTGGALVRKQMADAGLGALPFFGGDGISDAAFISTAGPAADGTYFTVAATAGDPSFDLAYRHRWDVPVGAYSANGYAAAQVAIGAIEHAIVAGGDKLPSREAVRKDVAQTKDLATPVGKIGFDAAGDTTNPVLTLYKIAGARAHFAGLVAGGP